MTQASKPRLGDRYQLPSGRKVQVLAVLPANVIDLGYVNKERNMVRGRVALRADFLVKYGEPVQ